MSIENGDKPAFQTPHVWAERWEMIDKIKESDGGLTKREYFAGLAMQGLCANGSWLQKATEHSTDVPGAVADAARDIADALLAELEKTA